MCAVVLVAGGVVSGFFTWSVQQFTGCGNRGLEVCGHSLCWLQCSQ